MVYCRANCSCVRIEDICYTLLATVRRNSCIARYDTPGSVFARLRPKAKSAGMPALEPEPVAGIADETARRPWCIWKSILCSILGAITLFPTNPLPDTMKVYLIHSVTGQNTTGGIVGHFLHHVDG